MGVIPLSELPVFIMRIPEVPSIDSFLIIETNRVFMKQTEFGILSHQNIENDSMFVYTVSDYD